MEGSARTTNSVMSLLLVGRGKGRYMNGLKITDVWERTIKTDVVRGTVRQEMQAHTPSCTWDRPEWISAGLGIASQLQTGFEAGTCTRFLRQYPTMIHRHMHSHPRQRQEDQKHYLIFSPLCPDVHVNVRLLPHQVQVLMKTIQKESYQLLAVLLLIAGELRRMAAYHGLHVQCERNTHAHMWPTLRLRELSSLPTLN